MTSRARELLGLHMLVWQGHWFLLGASQQLDDPTQLWTANHGTLVNELGLTAQGAQRLVDARRGVEPDRHREGLEKLGVEVAVRGEAPYPADLSHISDAPFALYHRGPLPQDGELVIGMVGTRGPTSYGREVAARMAQVLAAAGVVVVSGMAQGIDGESHKGALSSPGGRTVGVLATGLDIWYPAAHRDLYRQLWEAGTLVSEAPPGTPVRRWQFLKRNRIISGMARAVVVVEAPERSGALVTATLAQDQGRDVFAVPGPVTSAASAGTHRLVRDGATLIRDAADVLDHYGRLERYDHSPSVEAAGPGLMELARFGTMDLQEGMGLLEQVLGAHEISLEELVTRTGWSVGLVLARLGRLEGLGVVERRPGYRYRRRSFTPQCREEVTRLWNP